MDITWYVTDMALSYTAPIADGDFLPEFDSIIELRMTEAQETSVNRKRKATNEKSQKQLFYKHQQRLEDETCGDKYDKYDKYDRFGRNITNQEIRQERVPWVKVKYINGRLFVSHDKKIKMQNLGLV